MMTKPVFRHIFNNDRDKPIVAILEPWAEEYNIPSGKTLAISVYGTLHGPLETNLNEEFVVIYFWGGCTLTVTLDGEDCTRPSLNIVFPDFLRDPQTS